MNNDSWANFLSWEQASRDTIDFKTIYVDMADDLIAGLLLSQIVYWYLPSKKGGSKLRVFKDGYYWIAKARHEWWDEIRVKPRQIDRAITKLEEKGIIVSHVYRFNNAPTTHIRIDKEGFLAAWDNALVRFHEKVKSEAPADPFSPNRQFDFTDPSPGFHETVKSDYTESVQSITETTIDSSKIIAENTCDFPPEKNVVEAIIEQTESHPDQFELARITEEKRAEAGGNYAVPPPAGGANSFADGPLEAFAKFVAGVSPALLPAKTRRSWADKLHQIAEKWSTEENPITAEIMECAIRAVPDSDIGWKTYTSPYAGHFETDIGPLLLGGGQTKQRPSSDKFDRARAMTLERLKQHGN